MLKKRLSAIEAAMGKDVDTLASLVKAANKQAPA